MVPFLAVFALWHPAANSSQRRASPGGCESPWPQLGCLFSAGHRAGEKSSISLPVLNFSALPDFLSRLASSRATRRGTREVSPSFLSARAGSARLRVLVNVFLQQGPRGRKRRRRRRWRASEEGRKAGAPRHPGRESQPGASLAGEWSLVGTCRGLSRELLRCQHFQGGV